MQIVAVPERSNYNQLYCYFFLAPLQIVLIFSDTAADTNITFKSLEILQLFN
jgi:hypothetical protein